MGMGLEMGNGTGSGTGNGNQIMGMGLGMGNGTGNGTGNGNGILGLGLAVPELPCGSGASVPAQPSCPEVLLEQFWAGSLSQGPVLVPQVPPGVLAVGCWG